MGMTEEGIVHIPGLSSQWVRLPNGARAHYVTAGDTGPLWYCSTAAPAVLPVARSGGT